VRLHPFRIPPMKRRSFTAVLACAAACTAPVQRAEPPPAPVPVTQAGVPGAVWPEIYFPDFDRAVRAAGLEPLRVSPLPAGQREVRVWIGGGLGAPESLYRFVPGGSAVFGEAILYWEAEPPRPEERRGLTFHDWLVRSLSGRCADIQVLDQMAVCRARFIRPPEWDQVLAGAEAAGLWTLPDASTLPDDGVVTLDGWALTVELRDGAAYRAYQYANPQAHAWPAARQAERIAEHVRGLDSLFRPAGVPRE